MEENNRVTAPQITNVDRVYQIWLDLKYHGSKTSFYSFITTPSVERDMFIRCVKTELDCRGTVIIHSITES